MEEKEEILEKAEKLSSEEKKEVAKKLLGKGGFHDRTKNEIYQQLDDRGYKVHQEVRLPVGSPPPIRNIRYHLVNHGKVSSDYPGLSGPFIRVDIFGGETEARTFAIEISHKSKLKKEAGNLSKADWVGKRVIVTVGGEKGEINGTPIVPPAEFSDWAGRKLWK